MSKDVEGEIIIRGDGEEGSLGLSKDLLRAVYHTITDPKETYEVERRAARYYTENNITRLVEMLGQWARSYNPVSYGYSISVTSLPDSDKKGRDYSGYRDIEGFLRRAPAYAGRTEDISISLELVLHSEEHRRIVRHSATIELSGSVYAMTYTDSNDGDDLDGSHLSTYRNESTASVRMTYGDYMVARALVAVFDEWYRGLERRIVRSRRVGFFSNVDRRLLHTEMTSVSATFFFPLVISSVLVGSLYTGGVLPTSLRTDTFAMICVLILVFCVNAIVMSALAQKADEEPYRHMVPLAEITSADSSAAKKYTTEIDKLRDNARYWNRFIIGQIIVNVAGAVLAYFLG